MKELINIQRAVYCQTLSMGRFVRFWNSFVEFEISIETDGFIVHWHIRWNMWLRFLLHRIDSSAFISCGISLGVSFRVPKLKVANGQKSHPDELICGVKIRIFFFFRKVKILNACRWRLAIFWYSHNHYSIHNRIVKLNPKPHHVSVIELGNKNSQD